MKKGKKKLDFTNAEPNPYAKRLKQSVYIRLNDEVIEYFKALSAKEDIPYQTLINSYLLDCAKNKRDIHWK